MKVHHSTVWRWVSAWTAGVLLAVLAGHAGAQNAVEAVTGSTQGGADVVRVELSRPLPTVPNGFTIQSPARIVIDLPGVSNGMGRTTIDLNQGNLRSANVVQSGDRSRLVLNLKSASGYRAETNGKTLIVYLDAAPSAAPAATAAAAAATTFSEDRSRDVLPLKDVDFRRTADGVGQVVVDLPNSQVGVDIRNQGQSLVVEFMKSSLPDNLRRRLDVKDFGTPVQSITTFENAGRVRMVIEPSGNWEHTAYQSDNRFVVEVRPVKVDPGKLTAGVGYGGEKLSLNFQNIEVRSLLQVIADFTNFNIVTSDNVTGSVTLRLKDVPWDQALDIILQAKNLGMRKSGNVITIAPKAEIAAKEREELEARNSLQSLEPVRMQVFQLNYAKAADIAPKLTAGTAAARILSPRGSVLVEARTNQLFVTDIPSRLEQVQMMIGKLDVAVRQVMIEARIVEASDSFGRSLGVRLGGSDLRAVRGGDGGYSIGNGNRVAFGSTYSAAQSASGESSGSGDTTFVSLPASGQGGASPATFALSLFNSAANRYLNLEISAMEAEGKGRVVSSPRVITADQVAALIEQGTEYPYQKATSSGATSVEFKKANLKLEVTPQITPEGGIILQLDVTKDSKGEETTQGIAINTKHVKTEVLVENGGTVVIGGIFELTESENVAKVPLLGDLPGIGNLFKSRTRSSNKQETLVFITPRVVTEKTTPR